MLNLDRFADDTRWIRSDNRLWLVHAHKRNKDGRMQSATAAIFAATVPPIDPAVPQVKEESRRNAIRSAFGVATWAQLVDIDALKALVGEPDWRDSWNERVRELGGAVIDVELLARALSCLPYSGAATLEVGPMTSVGGETGQVVRLVGADWIVIVAGRTDTPESPLDIGAAKC